MDALVEAHTADELQRAMALDAPIVGVNSRDLQTFRIDRAQQLDLVSRAAGHEARLVIAESGVHTRAQGAAAELAGADAILVGAALMQAADPAAKLRQLLSRPLAKVCGLTRQDDVDAAVEAGADLLGFILVERSPRRAELLERRQKKAVALLAEATAKAQAAQAAPKPEPAQDHVPPKIGAKEVMAGFDNAMEIARTRRLAELARKHPEVARLLDQPWQEHDPEHWRTAAAAAGRVVLAGGLAPGNVRDAIAAVQPWGVDASSSLEREPGVKDHEKVRAFVEAVHA